MTRELLTGLRGCAFGSAGRTVELFCIVGELTLDLSSRALRGARRLCRGGVPRARRPGRREMTGAGLERVLLEQRLAPSTARRYRQITDRFTARFGTAPEPGAVERCLAAAGGETAAGGDPRHLALRRTTLCALRSALDGPFGMELTRGIQMPPRAAPVPAAEAGAVAALRGAAADSREGLMLVLTCDLGLRPGEMAALRRDAVRLRGERVRVVLRRRTVEAVLPPERLALVRAAVDGSAAADGCLFPSPRGGGTAPVTVRALQIALRRLCARAGVAPGVTFTRLRKAGAAAEGAAVQTRTRKRAMRVRPAPSIGRRRGRPDSGPGSLHWHAPAVPCAADPVRSPPHGCPLPPAP